MIANHLIDWYTLLLDGSIDFLRALLKMKLFHCPLQSCGVNFCDLAYHNDLDLNLMVSYEYLTEVLLSEVLLISFYFSTEIVAISGLSIEVCHQFHECLAPYRLNDFCCGCLLACLIFISVWST